MAAHRWRRLEHAWPGRRGRSYNHRALALAARPVPVVPSAPPAKYADQELFTEAQREELDKERTEVLNRRAVGTPNDAYNFAVFLTTKRTGARTSKIIDP